MLLQAILMALREIRRNAMRSALTMIGVVIGVGAVITLVTLGRGATEQVTQDIAKMGKNLLMVHAGSWRRGGGNVAPLTLDDVDAIRSDVGGAGAVAATAQRQALAVSGNENWRTQVTGAEAEFFTIRGYELTSGRAFTDAEARSGRASCVLGATVRTKLYGSTDPVGTSLRVDRVSCEVIGVLGSKGQAAMGQDQDDLIVMPLKAFQRRLAGTNDIGSVLVSADEARDTVAVRTQLEGLLRERRGIRPGTDDDFSVRDMQEIADAARSATGVLTTLLGAIAAVSLLVGGIGIMNIMLVSVTERTREIGIRLAIGALASEVLVQFLAEAIVLSTLGGAIGVALGLAGSWGAAHALKMPFVLVPEIIALAFVFSALVGIVFGYLPARKAAHLNPIEALRHE